MPLPHTRELTVSTDEVSRPKESYMDDYDDEYMLLLCEELDSTTQPLPNSKATISMVIHKDTPTIQTGSNRSYYFWIIFFNILKRYN